MSTTTGRCSHCHHVSNKLISIPKTYDFSFKHAMTRCGKTPKEDEVCFQKYSYFFENDSEMKRFLSEHPDIWVTDWYLLCPTCYNSCVLPSESFDRIMAFIEKRIGENDIEKTVITQFVPRLPELLKEHTKKLKKERLKEKKLSWRLGL